MGETSLHKYLGKCLSGDLHSRARNAVHHRVQFVWAKLKLFQHISEDKHVSIALRFRFFDAVVKPTLLYSLETVALTKQLERRLDVTQRKMFRRMVGWVYYGEEAWDVVGERM